MKISQFISNKMIIIPGIILGLLHAVFSYYHYWGFGGEAGMIIFLYDAPLFGLLNLLSPSPLMKYSSYFIIGGGTFMWFIIGNIFGFFIYKIKIFLRDKSK